MTDRRAFLAGAVALLTMPRVAGAQQPGRIYRLGYLGSVAEASTRKDPATVAFWARLQELGWVEGQNLTMEYRSSEGQNERYRALADELVRVKVDLIVAPGTAAARAAKEATGTIPIVTVLVGDPVGSGLVASLARPGGNVTGMSSAAVEVGAKQLELLRELAPRLSRVAALWTPTNPLVEVPRRLEAAARSLNVRLQRHDVRTAQDIDAAFAAMVTARTEAVIAIDDVFMYQQRRRIAELALQHRLPTISTNRAYPEAGLLMSYGAGFAYLFPRAAVYVDKILRGAKPAELPVEQPTVFELVVNARTAKTLKVTLPASLQKRVDHVIQ